MTDETKQAMFWFIDQLHAGQEIHSKDKIYKLTEGTRLMFRFECEAGEQVHWEYSTALFSSLCIAALRAYEDPRNHQQIDKPIEFSDTRMVEL